MIGIIGDAYCSVSRRAKSASAVLAGNNLSTARVPVFNQEQQRKAGTWPSTLLPSTYVSIIMDVKLI